MTTTIPSAYRTQLLFQAQELRKEAERLPRGRARDALLQYVQKLEGSAVVEGWVSPADLISHGTKLNAKARHFSKWNAGAH